MRQQVLSEQKVPWKRANIIFSTIYRTVIVLKGFYLFIYLLEINFLSSKVLRSCAVALSVTLIFTSSWCSSLPFFKFVEVSPYLFYQFFFQALLSGYFVNSSFWNEIVFFSVFFLSFCWSYVFLTWNIHYLSQSYSLWINRFIKRGIGSLIERLDQTRIDDRYAVSDRSVDR